MYENGLISDHDIFSCPKHVQNYSIEENSQGFIQGWGEGEGSPPPQKKEGRREGGERERERERERGVGGREGERHVDPEGSNIICWGC